MSIIQAVILGLIQGLTEFLPVSSSGHLVLFRNLMSVEAAPLVFEVVVHVGTLIAVCAVFYRDIWYMIRHPLSKQTIYLVVATIPAVIVTLLFSDFVEGAFEGAMLGFGFLITAGILCLSEYLAAHNRKNRSFREMKATDALVMGCMQAVALVPGISRSGSTISGGLFTGLNRKLAAKFSFLMSVPAILGSLVFEFKDLVEFGSSGEVGWLVILIGALVAAVSGFFAIKYMMKLISEKKLYVFAIYVAIVGVFVLFDQLVTNWFFTNPFI